MKKFILILISMLICNLLYSNFQFRDCEFGMSKTQIQEIEVAEFLYTDTTTGSLVYVDSLFGEDIYVVYLFDSTNCLTTLSYLFIHTWENDEWYYLLFENCKQYIISQIGDINVSIRENNSLFFTTNSWADLMSAIKWKQGVIAHYWFKDNISVVLGIFPSGYFDKSLIIIFKEK